MDWIADPHAWIALLTLTSLEIVLGIDNIVFLSILIGRLPAAERKMARLIGLALAMLMRIALLFSLSALMRLTRPLFSVLHLEVSGKDLLLLVGGLFLLGKATTEIHARLESEEGHASRRIRGGLALVLGQVVVMDVVFSLDSVVTAIGMAEHLGVMVAAVVLAVLFMMTFSPMVTGFVDGHPTVKMLALSFLLLIGVSLVADGLHFHIPKGYLYFAMAFSLFVEILNIKLRGGVRPVVLRQAYVAEPHPAK